MGLKLESLEVTLPNPQVPTTTIPAVTLFDEEEVLDREPDASAIWELLHSYADVRDRGRALFRGSLSRRNKLFDEFSNYVKAAHAYYTAAEPVRDASAALLYYYAFLNLAKAELLATHPTEVFQQQIHHGLSYRPGSASRPMSARVRMLDGVFRLLFQKRTGSQAPAREELPVARLMPRATSSYAGGGEVWSRAELSRVHHTLCWNHTHIWSSIGIFDDTFLDYRPTARIWNAALKEVSPPRFVESAFRVRRLQLPWRFFETKDPAELATAGRWERRELIEAVRRTQSALAQVVDAPYDLASEGTAFPSLYKSRPLFMPASLCDYVLMYYCSSLTRYEPSKLDPALYGLQAWGLHHFVNNTGIRLLQDAYFGITGIRIRFTGLRGSRV